MYKKHPPPENNNQKLMFYNKGIKIPGMDQPNSKGIHVSTSDYKVESVAIKLGAHLKYDKETF